MSTPISGSGDNLDSSAILALMLEALSKASVELDKTVNILAEQLSLFNQGLDKLLRDEVSAARERMEAALRQNQDGLLKDRESVIKALSEFKQAEIEKIILAGKTVRTGLSAQAEEASRSLASQVAGKIAAFKEQISNPDLEIKEKFDQLQVLLRAEITETQKQLLQIRITEESSLAGASSEYKDRAIQALGTVHASFDAAFGEKRAELEAGSENVVGELAQKYDEVIERLEYSYQEGLAVLSEENELSTNKLRNIAVSANEFAAEQERVFQGSLQGLGELLDGLYEKRLNNLAAQSRTEIVSVVQHAEERLAAIKTEMQTCLNEFQRDFAGEFESLRTRLAKSLEELENKGINESLRGVKEDRVREQLHSLFRRLGQEMINGAANASKRLELEFQKSMDSFEQRIETAKTQACDSLTRESQLMQKELSRSFQDFEGQLAELQEKTSRLEKMGNDAANFVMTIRKANLNL